MTKLSVNVNKVATLRNTRPQLNLPSVMRAATMCLDAGAAGITVHPRPDQRHIRPRDVTEIAELLKRYPGREFNIEGNPFIEYLPLVEQTRPTQATLVPDTPEAFTSDHGWDLPKDGERLRPIIAQLKGLGARVSLFMDPLPEQMELARAIGADRVELYTEPYAAAFARGDAGAADPYAAAAERAVAVGLQVNAGHDLNLHNLPPFLRACPQVAEVSIGHALIADALELGLAETVRRYLHACGN
ncbi:MAG TPA: pyridoxine 5'-phosphate synthase [Tepidisphaeraceae bacterium]|nr:pyridoxine 5'-phosphate synthase [Tepidisphaeraceae bacterium]